MENKFEPYKESMDLSRPFEWLHEHAWDYISDYENGNEYSALDMMWNVLNEDWSIDEYNETCSSVLTLDDIKREYNERFPKLMAQAMKDIADDILNGKLIFKITK